jgi:hypothetical protein
MLQEEGVLFLVDDDLPTVLARCSFHSASVGVTQALKAVSQRLI